MLGGAKRNGRYGEDRRGARHLRRQTALGTFFKPDDTIQHTGYEWCPVVRPNGNLPSSRDGSVNVTGRLRRHHWAKSIG